MDIGLIIIVVVVTGIGAVVTADLFRALSLVERNPGQCATYMVIRCIHYSIVWALLGWTTPLPIVSDSLGDVVLLCSATAILTLIIAGVLLSWLFVMCLCRKDAIELAAPPSEYTAGMSSNNARYQDLCLWAKKLIVCMTALTSLLILLIVLWAKLAQCAV